MPSGDVYAFGPFHLDSRSKRLLRDGATVDLPLGQFNLLQALVSRAGEVLTKEDLIAAAWDETVVEDNTLAKAILRLRRAIDPHEPEKYIATVARRGYRCVADVTRPVERRTDAEVDAVLAPHRALANGRAALEMLTREAVTNALTLLEPAVRRDPHFAALHVALANAYLLRYDATRLDAEPDVDSLRLAETHAREACRLNDKHAEAFATLGFVLDRMRAHADAIAALGRAVSLQDGNWRHHFRLAWVSWGEDRILAARRALAIVGHCPPAHWLVAIVLIARGELTDAEREVDAGLVEMEAESGAPAPYAAVGLDLLKGLLLLARGADNEGLAALAREVAGESSGHVYARVCAADAYYAIGACHLRNGDKSAARAGFNQAIARVPRHAMAQAGLVLLAASADEGSGAAAKGAETDAPASFDVALARAAVLAAQGDANSAARIVETALTSAPPGSAGWRVPIDPLLGVQHARAEWTRVLAKLRSRTR